MKITLCLLLFYTAINMQAQNLQGSLVYSHHNSTSTINPDTIYSIDNANQKTFITLGYRPRVSHGGNYMAFVNGQNSNQSLDASIFIRKLATHKDTLIFFNGGDYVSYYDFAPSDSQLVFDFACTMYAAKINGIQSYTDINCAPCNCYSDQPVSRLSDSLLTYHNVYYGIYTKNYDGSNPLKVPNTNPGDLFPAWSPDGQWIAWYKTTPGLSYITNAIYKIKPDGTNKTLLLQLATTDSLTPDPMWASGMTYIYFIARIQNALGIYKVKTDGSGNYQKIYAFDNTGIVNDYFMGLSDLVSSTLPLTLIDFTVSNYGKSIKLNWQTAQEINSNYFDVERSIDEKNFSKIGSIVAKGSNNTLSNYLFIDNVLPYQNTSQRILEYRLKIVDKDGQFTYSKIVAVNFIATSSIKIYPSLAKNILHLEGLNSSFTSTISIIDFSGSVIRKITLKNNNYLFDIASLPAGVYYVSIKQNKITSNLKFVKE